MQFQSQSNRVASKYLEPIPDLTASQMVARAEDYGLKIPTDFTQWLGEGPTGSGPSAQQAITYYNNSGRCIMFETFARAAALPENRDKDLKEVPIDTFCSDAEDYTRTRFFDTNVQIRLNYVVDTRGNQASIPVPSTLINVTEGSGDFRIKVKQVGPNPNNLVASLVSDNSTPAAATGMVRIFKDSGVVQAEIDVLKNNVVLYTRFMSDISNIALIDIPNVYAVRAYVWYESKKYAAACGEMTLVPTGNVVFCTKPSMSTAYLEVKSNNNLLEIPNAQTLATVRGAKREDPRY